MTVPPSMPEGKRPGRRVRSERVPTDAHLARTVARQVWRYRRRQKLTALELSQKITEVGGNLSRQAISRIENGERSVSLEELFAVARALSVPPTLLFLPIGEAARVELLPGMNIPPHLALKWISGEEPPVGSDRRPVSHTDMQIWQAAAVPLRLYREFDTQDEELRAAQAKLRRAEYVQDEDRLKEARAASSRALHEMAKVVQEMVLHGVRPPALAAETVEDMHAVGIELPASRTRTGSHEQ